MSEAGTCSHCGARVLWVGTQNDKRIALDYDAERRFVIDSGAMIARIRNTYTCHFNTCKKRPP